MNTVVCTQIELQVAVQIAQQQLHCTLHCTSVAQTEAETDVGAHLCPLMLLVFYAHPNPPQRNMFIMAFINLRDETRKLPKNCPKGDLAGVGAPPVLAQGLPVEAKLRNWGNPNFGPVL